MIGRDGQACAATSSGSMQPAPSASIVPAIFNIKERAETADAKRQMWKTRPLQSAALTRLVQRLVNVFFSSGAV
jgi:hypothetical protein